MQHVVTADSIEAACDFPSIGDNLLGYNVKIEHTKRMQGWDVEMQVPNIGLWS